ncbi:MAG: aminotransferase class III-fold pyridoxal phosphate-dependent enzyme [Acutalibacteraceae bacterium]
MIDFAELLVDTVQTADWAFFAKNGNDVTTLAVMTARAFTRRKKIVFFKGYYHGVSPWTQKIDYSGVLKEDVCNQPLRRLERFRGLEALFEAHEGEIAAVISQPYMHGNFADNELPADGFWQKVRRLCTEQGALLIVDDVRRLPPEPCGQRQLFRLQADLICFCKAIANGYNVSALCGKDFLKNTVSGISFTGSYWLSAVPFAAGIACLEKMKKLNLPELLIEKGKRLTDGLTAAARKHGYDLRASGMPSLFYLRIADDDNLMTHQRFIAEMVRRGVYMTNHHNHFINYALSDADIDETVEIADEVLRLL